MTVFKASNLCGGHAWTVPVPTAGGATDVDVGFMVFNESNYSHVCVMFG